MIYRTSRITCHITFTL